MLELQMLMNILITKVLKKKNFQTTVSFLHAFSGCDTTSAFYKKGKNKLINAVTPAKLIEIGSIFNKPDANREELASNAYRLICVLYSDKAEKALFEKSGCLSLNDLRYLHYSKGRKKKNFTFESLPPTEGAAKQHAFRTYMQVQTWLGNNNLKPTEWGWEVRNDHLIPIATSDPPIPKQLLQQISCSCKGNCKSMLCSCKKHGLRCTDLCVNCMQSENETSEICENFDHKAPIIDDEEEYSEKIVDAADTFEFPNFQIEIDPQTVPNDSDSDEQILNFEVSVDPQTVFYNDSDDSD